jgi:PPE-repeat protein
MFAGAGPAPMLTTAATWDGLATELGLAASLFDSVIAQLATESWQGPAAAAMAGAAAPYAGWLIIAAARAGCAAAQAKAAVTAFGAARAASVHPAMVAANRTRLVSLVASNLLGQNTPAIATAEAQYDHMWAQDVAALVGYHGRASAVAVQLASWHQWLQHLPSLPRPARRWRRATGASTCALEVAAAIESAAGTPPIKTPA